MPVVGLTALVLIPPLVLIAVIVPGLRYEPVTQSTAADIKTNGLPSRPTSLSPDDVWHQDFDNLLDVTSGAAGPVVLAEEGVVGLDPADGTRRWSYHRQDATYLSVPEASGIALYGVDYFRPPQSQYLITSPDERYIALRVDGPGRVMPQTPPCVTIVLDAVTGEVVSEHLSDGGPLQLTDSAVLDGTIAYELDKGAKLWDLKAIGIKAESIRYSGTAGHSSFVLGFTHESDSDTGFSHGTLTLAPQDAPSQQRQSPPLMLEVDQEHLVVIAGWTVAIKGGGPSDLSGSPTEGWQAQALSLDAMAGVAGADTHAHDLGAGYGIGDAASRSSGRLALLSSPTPWQGSYAGYSPSQEWCAATTVSAVFDPRSRTVTGASDTPGLAAGAVGLSHGQPDDAEGDHVVIRPGGGASQITFPLDPPPAEPMTIDDGYNPDLKEINTAVRGQADITGASTPGATLVIIIGVPIDHQSHATMRIYGLPAPP
ncbi:hypothetical protein E4J66_01390 [Actinomyces viscosus]|uniref:PQQ enzyme repeat n=1 Tax=Actinomyces viscosus TaxID=1656 RepID=A0A3S4WIQ5_ACTVI|nr:hypothetical protein [Actinomyces viscosus]TFH53930.1 hypothetical protein E4J66_01390 [Actinomyces viscosus]VEI14926.1 Uncharacterised protein [Actinomyces viscosus]